MFRDYPWTRLLKKTWKNKKKKYFWKGWLVLFVACETLPKWLFFILCSMLDGWLGQQQKKNRKHHSQIVHLLPLDDFALVMSFFLDFNFVSEQKKKWKRLTIAIQPLPFLYNLYWSSSIHLETLRMSVKECAAPKPDWPTVISMSLIIFFLVRVKNVLFIYFSLHWPGIPSLAFPPSLSAIFAPLLESL